MKSTNHFPNKKRMLFAAILVAGYFLSACQPTSKNKETSPDFPFLEYDITQLQNGLSEGDFTSKELVQAYLDRIREIDMGQGGLHSIICINPEAISIAEELDEERKMGKIRGPLHGIPVVLKDNIDTHDKMPTTAGSRALMHSYPLKDSFVSQKLREAGAVILGKANLSEWANMRGEPSSSGWSGVGGQTNNPYDLTKNPCGSSSGSAVAVSANLTVFAIGTETNGSIVCPANANGIVGLKPTVGLISRSGIIPISFTQDTPGPMTRTVKDAAIALGAMVGVDSTDSKTLPSMGNVLTDYTPFLELNGLEGKRIGRWKAAEGINVAVDSLLTNAYHFMLSQGAEVVDVDEITDTTVYELSFKVMLYEYKDGLNAYFKSLGKDAPVKSLEELIEFNKKDSIEMKYYNQLYLEMAQQLGDLTSEEYLVARDQLRLKTQDLGLDRIMDSLHLDAIAAPTGSPAWTTDWVNGDNFSMSSSSPAAQSGYPNISVPMGAVSGLPVGISFFGRAWSEPELLEIAYAYEQGTMQRHVPTFIHLGDSIVY